MANVVVPLCSTLAFALFSPYTSFPQYEPHTTTKIPDLCQTCGEFRFLRFNTIWVTKQRIDFMVYKIESCYEIK